jgi:hypothetical protein
MSLFTIQVFLTALILEDQCPKPQQISIELQALRLQLMECLFLQQEPKLQLIFHQQTIGNHPTKIYRMKSPVNKELYQEDQLGPSTDRLIALQDAVILLNLLIQWELSETSQETFCLLEQLCNPIKQMNYL